jgi:uncharacterized protein
MGRVTFLVSAGARRTELGGRHGDGWKARVGARAERGRANEALVRLVAEALGVARSDVTVAAGRSARAKVLVVAGLADAEIDGRLEAYSRKGRTS